MSKILLTGATGFLGQHIQRELIAAGHQVRALSRSASADTLLASHGAEPVRAELTDAESLMRAAKDIDAIFHTAADTNTWRVNNASQTRTNVGGIHKPLLKVTNSVLSNLITDSRIALEDVRGGD